MPSRFSRRRLLVTAAALGAGTALIRVRPGPALADGPVSGTDIVAVGAALRQGTMDGLVLAEAPSGPVLRPTGTAGIYSSAVLESPRPFTHVGLHWIATGTASDPCQMELRTSADSTTWSVWRPVPAACLPGKAPRGETVGGLLFARDARFLQYRASLSGADAALEQVTATVISSPPQPLGNELHTVTVRDSATGRSLAVTPRELWLADENLRFDAGGAKVWNEMFVPVKKLVVHHTATRNDYATVEEAAAEVRAIYYYHAVTLGWGDIGYNALVDQFGNLYEGRYGRGSGVTREMLSEGVVAGHDLYHNYGSAGVALVGNAVEPDWPMPEPAGPMWEALLRYSTFESGRAFLRPLVAGAAETKAAPEPARSDFLRSDDVWSDAMRNVSGHRETNDTTCPGDVVMGMLDDLRVAIDAGLADTSRTGAAISASGREAALGEPLVFRAIAEPPEPGWRISGYEYTVEGWYRPPGVEDIDYRAGFGPGPQPYPVWSRTEIEAPVLEITFTPVERGHYTLHVRPLLERGSGKKAERQLAAYEGNHTYLVGRDDG